MSTSQKYFLTVFLPPVHGARDISYSILDGCWLALMCGCQVTIGMSDQTTALMRQQGDWFPYKAVLQLVEHGGASTSPCLDTSVPPLPETLAQGQNPAGPGRGLVATSLVRNRGALTFVTCNVAA